MSEPILQLANVESAYGPVKAIRGVSLTVARAYVAASKRRISPPQFPPLPVKPVNRTASR